MNVDTERPDDATDDAYEPVEVTTGIDMTVDAEPPAPKTRMVLGTLAGLGVALVGVGVWALLYRQLDKDFPGVSVVFALIIGYVVREVSRRSDLVPRIVASVLTAVLIVVGSVIALSAWETSDWQERGLPVSFQDVLEERFPQAFELLGNQRPLTLVIFGAAVVVAFLSAAPPRPKQVKTAPASDPEPEAGPEFDSEA